MTTNDRIAKMIGKQPLTRQEIAFELGVKEKTVRNRLGEIHEQCDWNGVNFAVFLGSTPRDPRYGIIKRPVPPRSKTVSGKRYRLQNIAGKIEGGIYSTVVYKQ
jgi:predicted transcriptional regulator